MTRRSLKTVLKVRRASVDKARALLVAAVAAAEAAANEESRVDAEIRSELAAAASTDVDDAGVEAVSAWLPFARQRQTVARERRQAAELATIQARAALAAARAAEESVEILIAGDAAKLQEIDKKESNNALDDTVRREVY